MHILFLLRYNKTSLVITFQLVNYKYNIISNIIIQESIAYNVE